MAKPEIPEAFMRKYPRITSHIIAESLGYATLDIIPVSPSRWADVVYNFSRHEGMKYDRDKSIYGIDGQPRLPPSPSQI